jgi:hypothetical protein
LTLVGLFQLTLSWKLQEMEKICQHSTVSHHCDQFTEKNDIFFYSQGSVFKIERIRQLELIAQKRFHQQTDGQ